MVFWDLTNTPAAGKALPFIGLSALIAAAVPPLAAEEPAERASVLLAQRGNGLQSLGRTEIKNIQRLLKLLADGYPETYGTVDPKRVDGRLDKSTKAAIQNYIKISNSPVDTGNGEQLVAFILSTLAQMSVSSDPEAAPDKRPLPAGSERSTAMAAPAPPGSKPATSSEAVTPSEVFANERMAAADSVKSPSEPIYFVQVASLRSLDAAKNEWERIFAQNRAALRGEQVYFERATIPDKGVFFRILIGPMQEQGAARTLCNFLRNNDQSCVVIPRNRAELRKATREDATSGSTQRSRGEIRVLLSLASPGKPGKPASTPLQPVKTESVAAAQAPGVLPQSDEATVPENRAMSPAAATVAEPSEKPEPNTVQSAKTAPAPLTSGGSGTREETTTSRPPETPVPTVHTQVPTVHPQVQVPTPKDEAQTRPPFVTGSDEAPSTAVAKPGNNAASAPPPPTSPVADQPTGEKAAPAVAKAPQTDLASGAGTVSELTMQTPQTTEVKSPTQRSDKLKSAIADLFDALGLDGTAGITVALFAGAGIFFFFWRTERKLALTQIFKAANDSLNLPMESSEAPSDTLSALENDFASDNLQQSRSVRDEFLHDILGDEVEHDASAPKADSAIRINTSLKLLLASDPALYKSIFLNWIFLAKVGSALNNREIKLEELSRNLSEELNLLHDYFKIHLLELDDRHRIRKQLPGLFYCLQMAQEQKKKMTKRFSAA